MSQLRGEGQAGVDPVAPLETSTSASPAHRLGVAPLESTPAHGHGAPAATGAEELAAIAQEAALRSVRFVAWRDLDDPEAGGSELHAHRVATLWAAAGIDVDFRTSAVPGGTRTVLRDGYRVTRRSGRYAVFPSAAAEGLGGGRHRGEGLVEVWNGMPFFSPLWYRGPRITFLHHVHAEMWRMVLPDGLARLGELVERRLAPPLYRRTRVVTLSQSAKDEIVSMLRLPAEGVTVAPPGVEPRFSPGGTRSATPLVVAVGRLVPVKRFDLLIEALVRARTVVPDLEAVIVGEGYERGALEALRRHHRAEGWLSLPGRASDDELLDWYRQAWVVASTSQREGWGMTLTEAGACGTPAVATDIAGHRDAVLDGRTGLLVDGTDAVAAAIAEVLSDAGLRARLGRGAIERSRWFTWQATARTTLEALADECCRRS